MAKRCVICGKAPVAGHSVSHSNIKNRRRFEPNLQSTRLQIGGRIVRARVCTRCLRTARKTTA